jgi:hypothetical protein
MYESPLRLALNRALDNICRLEGGLARACSSITDPDQLEELRRAKKNIIEALNLEVQSAPETDRGAQIGEIENTGEHKGEIYGGIFPDGRPGWIFEEPELMPYSRARDLKGGTLPNWEEGRYIHSIKDKGDLKDLFARHSDYASSGSGFFCLLDEAHHGRYQQFSDGKVYVYINQHDSPVSVLSIRR